MSKLIKNLVVFPDYMDDINQQSLVYNPYFDEQNLFIFNPNILQNYQDKITLDTIEEIVVKYLSNLKIDFQQTIIVAKGLLATIICRVKTNFNFQQTILINPIFADALINPYTSNKPSYKLNLNHVWQQTLKEYYQANKIFIDKQSLIFIERYKFYTQYWEYHTKITSLLNDFIYLKSIKNQEKNYNLEQTIVLLGAYNKVIDVKKTKNILHKMFPKTLVVDFNFSSHHLEMDEPLKLLCWLKIFFNED